jgi:peptidoglycan/LPS O-acetylase OafA/YrhL
MNAGTNNMQRIHGLDLLRAAAILMVLTAHYPKAGSGLLIRLLNLGWAGVDLFFVLSGYLIARQLLKPLADGNEVSLREFYLSRLMRTLPCYWVTLAVYFLISSVGMAAAPMPAWKFLTFSQNFGIPNVFSPSWSLCVEEHFYAFFPLVVLFGARRDLWGGLIRGAAAVLVLALIVRSALWLAIRPDQQTPVAALDGYMTWFYYPSYCRLDGIILGVALAAIQQLHPSAWRRLMSWGNWLILSGAICFGGAVLVLWQRYSFLCCTFGFTLLSLSFTFFTAAAVCDRSILARLRIPGARPVALFSYSIYLTHMLALEAAAGAASYCGISLQSLPGIFVAFIFLATFAAVLYRGVELPFLNLRSRYLAASRKQSGTGRLIPVREAQ